MQDVRTWPWVQLFSDVFDLMLDVEIKIATNLMLIEIVSRRKISVRGFKPVYVKPAYNSYLKLAVALSRNRMDVLG